MNKFWLSHYPQGVPTEIQTGLYKSLSDYFQAMCDKYATREAFRCMKSSMTYAEILEKSQSFASYLRCELKLKKGDRIAIMMPNLLQYPVAIFGAFFAGCVVVNINPLYTGSELKHQLNDAEVETIVIIENFAYVLESVLGDTPVKHVVVTSIGGLLGFPKSVVVNSVVRYIKRMVPKWQISQAVSMFDALKIGKSHPFEWVTTTGEDIAFLQYTGGTTGGAKGAILTHNNMLANIEQASTWISPLVTCENEIVVTALPLYHIFALLANLLTFLKFGALNILIPNPRDMKSMLCDLKGVPFTAITGVNTLFNALVHQKKFAQLDFSRLHVTLGGGMAVQESVAQEWQRITGAPLLEAYGLTETSPAAMINPIHLKAYNGSVGLPLASTEIMIRDEEGHAVACGEVGELHIRGPQVMRGYWKKPEETKLVLSDDGWLATGDIARQDEKGFIYIVDRKKDMICVSGFNVYPNEVEEVLVKHPDVLEAAVIGVNDKDSGELVKAFIVPKGGHVTEKEIIAHCRQSLTRYKVPKVIEFRDELPKSNVGKIVRRLLKP